MPQPSTNSFLDGPLGPIYAKTALPVIFVMGMNGMLSITDALFLGHFVGPKALAAVTLMFPLYMTVVALSTLVASGMSSILARHLGAASNEAAAAIFAGAHGLAATLGLILFGLFLLAGRPGALLLADGDAQLAAMGATYLGIIVAASPMSFVVAVNSDALRNEGRAGLMAVLSLLVSVANIAFNYVLISMAGLGVAGSALGTVAAQMVALGLLIAFRFRGRTVLRPSALLRHPLGSEWGRIMVLGAPQSLTFVGLAIASTSVIAALQWLSTSDYAATVSAYGIVTRIMTFCFLPLLGLAHAMQTITGHSFGAGDMARTRSSLRMAVVLAFGYCLCIQIGLSLNPREVGTLFLDDVDVAAEVGRILPVILSLFFAAGPLMMAAMHFQAIGDAGRAALLGLSKPYLFAVPLTFGLAAALGEPGIWLATPAAEVLLIALTASVLLRYGIGTPITAARVEAVI